MGARDGLVHISEIKNGRVAKVSEVLTEGQEVKVKVLGIDDRGKVRRSMRLVYQEAGEELPDTRPPREEREPRGDRGDRGDRGGRGGSGGGGRDGDRRRDRGDRDRGPRRERSERGSREDGGKDEGPDPEFAPAFLTCDKARSRSATQSRQDHRREEKTCVRTRRE